MAAGDRTKGTILAPGVQVLRDTFVGAPHAPLAGRAAEEGRLLNSAPYIWTNTTPVTNLVYSTVWELYGDAARMPNRNDDSGRHFAASLSPYFDINDGSNPNVMTGGAGTQGNGGTTIQYRIKQLPGDAQGWGVVFGIVFNSGSDFPNVTTSIFWRMNANYLECYKGGEGGSSGSSEVYRNNGAHPKAGDIVRWTWDPVLKRVTCFNATANEVFAISGFQEPGYGTVTITESSLVAIVGGSTYAHSKFEVDDFSVYFGTYLNPPNPPSADFGGAVRETAVVSIAATVVAELWENGVWRADLGYYDTATERVLTIPFSADALTDKTGAGVELRLRGAGSHLFDIGGVSWDARYVGVNATFLTSSDSGAGTEGTPTLVRFYAQTDAGTGTDAILTFDDGRIFKNSPDSGTGTDAEVRRYSNLAKLPPDAIVASTNTTGAVGTVQDDPATPDTSDLVATSNTSATDVRVSFPTPSADLNVSGSQRFRIRLKESP